MNILDFLRSVHSPNGPEDVRVREVLSVLAMHRNRETGRCNPGIRRIADYAHMNPKTVQRKLEAAERAGWVRREVHRRGGRRGAWTQYWLLNPVSVPSHGGTLRRNGRKPETKPEVEDDLNSDPVDMEGAYADPERMRAIREALKGSEGV